MKEGCSVTKLMDVATLINGRAFSKNEFHNDGKYPILRVGNFFSNDEWYYSNFELEENKYCDNGDLLFAWSASFGPKIWDGGKVIYHYHIWKLILSDLVNKEYLYFYLQNMTEKIKKQGHGVTMQHVTKSDMEKMPINLPPLPEQKRIAEILTAADSAIEEADRAVNESERAKQGLMQTLIPDEKDGAKEGWKTTTIKEIFDVKSGTTPSTSEKKYWDDGNIYWVTPADLSGINEHLYIEHSNKKITETALKETGLIIVPKDTIIISTRAPVGTLALAKCDLTFNQGCRGLINRDESCYDTKFYYYYLLGKTIDLQNQSGGSTFKELSKARLESFPVPLPTITEQKRIAEILSVADEKIELCKQRKAILVKTKQGLMQKLLGGIDV